MTDNERRLTRERNEAEKALTATRADLDQARADLAQVIRAAEWLLGRTDFWHAAERVGLWSPGEIDDLADAVKAAKQRTEA